MSDRRPAPDSPIAIVGLDVLLPGTPGRPGFWRDILSARDCITEVPPSHWLVEDYYDPDPSAPDKTYCKWGGFLDPVAFDPLAFGVPPTALSSTDTAQLLALVLARRVLDQASDVSRNSIDKARTSIILGVASSTEMVVHLGGRLQRPNWVAGMREEGLPESQVQRIADLISETYVPWRESSFPGLLGNVVAGRIANRLDLGGSNYVTDAACASSLSALQAGLNELRLGQADTVIAGGVDALNDILMYMCFSKTPAFSPTGDCRPFSDKADGTILGEGLAMLALRRLEDAERDGNRIYGVVRGLGSGSDGQATSVYAPKPEGQAQALRRAYEDAGYSPRTVELVEAHGTGTVAGDAAEFAGLKAVFGPEADGQTNWCALGSIKSQIGHTKAAAGAAGLFKAVMALNQKVLPPTGKVDRPNPKLGIGDSPFYLNTAARPWIRGDDHPRRAAVSSFGFGGSNFHLTVEEYVGTGRRPLTVRTMPAELFLLSADDRASLISSARAVADTLALDETGNIGRITAEAVGKFRASDAARLAVIASSVADLQGKLKQFVASPDKPVKGLKVGFGAPEEGKTAFLFPGQGSQYLGMGADLAISFTVARSVWDGAAGQKDFEGEKLHNLAFPAQVFDQAAEQRNADRLTEMANAQPSIGAVSLSQLAVLEQLGLKADAVAGHSFGEVMALHAAGVFDQADALHVARTRGQLMTEAAGSESGGMIALPMDRESAADLLVQSGADLVIANDNGPQQVVLSGGVQAIEKAMAFFTERGVSARQLPVANAFHSTIVAGGVKPFRTALDTVAVAAPSIPVIAGADACPYETVAKDIRGRLAQQIAQPINFRAQVDALYDAGVRRFVEVGPGAVLTGLVRQCLADRPHRAIALDRKGANGVETLLLGLAELAADGVGLAYDWLWQEAPADEEATAPPKHAVEIRGSNYGKPYPPQGGAAALHAPNPELPPVTRTATHIPEHNMTTPPKTDQKPFQSDPARPVDSTYYQQLADTHLAFQQSMADSHRVFLETMERMMGGGGVMPSGAVAHQAPAKAQAPASAPAPHISPAVQMPVAPEPQMMAPPKVVVPKPAMPDPVDVRSPVAAATPAVSSADTVIALVAEKTGYPADMLNLDMDLEADLGIDSIKQVEILSSLREALPGLAEPDPGRLSEMNTLRRIVDFVEAGAGELPAQVVTPAVPETVTAPAVAADSAILISVVAEKTGYPADMLSLDMELEADLGIDSIKQVEILSAVREQLPNMPEVDPSALSELRTLGAILDFLGGSQTTAAASSAASAALPVAAGSPSMDSSVLISVVAEKTGYPADMLNLDMELEADLGIDSIKQVEILSAVREQLPDMPEVDPGQLSELRTLGAILEFLGGSSGASPAADEPATPVVVPISRPATSSADVARWTVEAISAPASDEIVEAAWRNGVIGVMTDHSGIAPLLVSTLKEEGVKAVLVEKAAANLDGLIYFGSLVSNGHAVDPSDSVADAVMAASVMAEKLGRQGGLFVTVEDLGGDFGLGGVSTGARAWTSGLAALAGTAALEWPAAAVKSIDIDAGNRTAELSARAIADEILRGGHDREVALSVDHGRRIAVVSSASDPLAENRSGLRDDLVIVASAGARGITAAALLELTRHYRLKLALLGRSPMLTVDADIPENLSEPELIKFLAGRPEGRRISPPQLRQMAQIILQTRELRENIGALEKNGAEVVYHSVDITQADNVAEIVSRIRTEWGPVTGLIHGAGVLADRHLADKTRDQALLVAQTKVGGLANLLAATADDPLEMICLFSSAAGVSGNIGQSDYAMANRILDNVASTLVIERPDCVVKSIAWGPWDGGMVDDGLRDMFRARGIDLIPLDGGVAFLRRELETGGSDCRVIAGSAELGQARAIDSLTQQDEIRVAAGD